MSQVELEQTSTTETFPSTPRTLRKSGESGGARGGVTRRTWIFGTALVILIGLLALWTLGLRQIGSGPEVGQPAPDFTLALYEGGEVTLSDLRGQVVLLNFWASWCAPCRDEAAALERVWRDYKDQGVVFVGVDYVDLESSALEYLAEYDVTYPNGLDKGQRISRAYRIRGVPETFFVDKSGNIAPIFVNGAPQPKKISPITEAELRAGLDRLLSEGTSEESG